MHERVKVKFLRFFLYHLTCLWFYFSGVFFISLAGTRYEKCKQNIKLFPDRISPSYN